MDFIGTHRLLVGTETPLTYFHDPNSINIPEIVLRRINLMVVRGEFCFRGREKVNNSEV